LPCCVRQEHLFPYRPHQPGYRKRLRIAEPLLTTAACIWHNWATGALAKRRLTAYGNW